MGRARDRDLPRREESLVALVTDGESLVLDIDRTTDAAETERSSGRSDDADSSEEETGLALWCAEETS